MTQAMVATLEASSTGGTPGTSKRLPYFANGEFKRSQTTQWMDCYDPSTGQVSWGVGDEGVRRGWAAVAMAH